MDFSKYECDGQMDIYDYLPKAYYQIEKPIRLIELFGGIGAQAKALERIGANFEHYRLVEFDKYPVKSYNAIHGTDFGTMDITQTKGEDLGIVDTDKFTYLLTYSFPCQDLSVAGNMKGMTKGSGTRSGLLWEVERLLNEVEELPQVLLMENVPQVHSKKNMDDFQRWIDFLQNKGYSCYWQDLNAKDFGVAQSRNRCFMVSILGDFYYEFPTGWKLDKKMKDYLEDKVDEKYYITSEKAKNLIDKLIRDGKILTDKPRAERKCIYCENLLGKKGSLGMCNKHYIQYKRWGDPLHSDNKERATVDGYYRDGKTGRREHRVIYEQHYGVNLSEEQIIHHINFVKTDNRIENLYLYENASEHIKAHREYERIAESLDMDEEIVFEDGQYIKREREREHSDRQSICQLTSQESSMRQTALRQDTMQESATIEMTDQESSSLEEFEKYMNPNATYQPFNEAVAYPVTSQDFVRTGFQEICPTLAARDYKDPKITVEMEEWKK